MNLQGSCLCGAVTYHVDGVLEDLHSCHCSQCRKQSGHFMVAGSTSRDKVEIQGEDRLTWFESSPGYLRGFCTTCGSHLFWCEASGAQISVNAGALDGPTGLTMNYHIFVADKGDYYEVADGLPQHEGPRAKD